MTTAGVHHFAIQVRDLRAAEDFYVGVLGLRVVRRWPSADGGDGERSLWVETGDAPGTFLALEVAPGAGVTAAEDPTRAHRPGHHLLALRIAREQRASWESRLAAAGVAITRRTAFTLYFRDPEGNGLGLSHFPDTAPEEP